jgi:hypothetical protein
VCKNSQQRQQGKEEGKQQHNQAHNNISLFFWQSHLNAKFIYLQHHIETHGERTRGHSFLQDCGEENIAKCPKFLFLAVFLLHSFPAMELQSH